MLLIVVDNKRGCLPKFILCNPWIFDKCENMIFDLYQAESVEVILSASPASSKSLVSYTIQEAPRYFRNTEPLVHFQLFVVHITTSDIPDLMSYRGL